MSVQSHPTSSNPVIHQFINELVEYDKKEDEIMNSRIVQSLSDVQRERMRLGTITDRLTKDIVSQRDNDGNTLLMSLVMIEVPSRPNFREKYIFRMLKGISNMSDNPSKAEELKDSIYFQNNKGETALMIMFSDRDVFSWEIFNAFMQYTDFSRLVRMTNNNNETVIDYFNANYRKLATTENDVKLCNKIERHLSNAYNKTDGGVRAKRKSQRKKSTRNFRKRSSRSRRRRRRGMW